MLLCRLQILLVLAVAVLPHSAVQVDLIKGICYGPFPSKTLVSTQGELLDDYMSDVAKPLWGPRGRGDLSIMKKLGANTVRLYGNDPKQNHAAFLAEAQSVGLGVIPGMSDWPYLQSPDKCSTTRFNCYEQVKSAYLKNLKTGWLVGDAYHPALSHVIVINEPDLKLKGLGEIVSPRKFARGIISAVDGMLDAEKEAGATTNLIKFTATFSFALCTACSIKATWKDPAGKPALNQMLVLQDAFSNPREYGYSPHNDLKHFYETRFINSFNTQNTAPEVQRLFLDSYEHYFPDTEVTIEEFHNINQPARSVQKDVTEILDIARSSKLLLGVSFFEYQVRYDKGGSEEQFGMFGLGDYKITTLEYFGIEYPVWCLKQVVQGPPVNEDVPTGLRIAYGGKDDPEFFSSLCLPNAATVSLDETGFSAVSGNPATLSTFVTRMVRHMGGEVVEQEGLRKFAASAHSFSELANQLYYSKPSWARWDPLAACVADRAADASSVGKEIAWACEQTAFNCAGIPSMCMSTVWEKADYVFSVYYSLKEGNPMEACYMDGSAIFARAAYYLPKDPSCVVSKDPSSTPLSDEGYQAVITQNSTETTSRFLERVILFEFGATVADRKALMDFAAQPPSSMFELKRNLGGAQWLCGGTTERVCPVIRGGRNGATAAEGRLAWLQYGFVFLACICLGGVIATIFYVRAKKTWRRMEKRCGSCFGGADDSDSDSDG